MQTSEIRSELRELFSSRAGVADGVVSPLAFVTVNSAWGLGPAAVAGLGSALLIAVYRLTAGRPLRFALAGGLGTLFAVLLSLRSGSAEAFFLPGIVTGALTSLLIVVSIAAGRPFVAWTSWLTRGWPIDWYWHPSIRPAYARASWLWAAFFASRALAQWRLFAAGETELLGMARVIMGWPMLVLLLITTYALGRRWLRSLAGPSVEEFSSGSPPPWRGQQTGF